MSFEKIVEAEYRDCISVKLSDILSGKLWKLEVMSFGYWEIV